MSDDHQTQKAGLGWGNRFSPNPPPSWCTKQRPCDYDKQSAYCPHRECRINLVAAFDLMFEAKNK